MDQNAVQIWSTVVTTIVQVATLVVVIVYTVYTAKMTTAAKTSADAANNTIKEMKEARNQENAPYIVIYFDIPLNKHLIYLIIKNVGKSIATDVKFIFTPSLESTVFTKINDVSLIKEGISSLPPNYEIRTLFDGVIQRFGNSNFPMKYTVEVSYIDGTVQERKTNSQTLDLSIFYGLMRVNEKGLDEAVKEIENLAKHTDQVNHNLKEIAESLTSGIWIKNPTLTTSVVNPQQEAWHDSMLAKLQEFSLLWTSMYGKSEDKLVDPFLTNLQNTLLLLSSQLIAILSENSRNTSKKVEEGLGSFAAKLQALGLKRFYIDGGASVEEFNKLGDSAAQDSDLLRKQILQEREKQIEEFD